MKKRQSVARRVMRKTLVVVFSAMLILLAAAYCIVKDALVKDTRKFSTAIATVYADTIAMDAKQKDAAVNESFRDRLEYYGNYVCKWYSVDYAYVFVLDEENGRLHYYAATCNEEKFGKQEDLSEQVTSLEVQRDFTAEEWAVWSAEGSNSPVVVFEETDNEYGHEYSTIMRQYDQQGNKFLVGVDMSYEDMYQHVFQVFGVIALVILLALGAVGVTVYYVVSRRVSKPAKTVAAAMDGFITDGDRQEVDLPENVLDDEFNRMAVAFNRMTENIDNYVENINRLTRDNERQETELEIAAHIQRGIMPTEHLLSEHYEMHTLMKPAKNMGGDFYDNAVLDDRRVLVVIADVSGKGVPAAIFMAVAFTVIHQLAEMGLSPAEILKRANDYLCRNNPAMQFVTALVGVYDTKANTFTYANAGHDRPYIMGKTVSRLDGLSGMILGLYEGESYGETSVTLKNGETLFLYTDGVTEAENAEQEFFGKERLEAVLAKAKETHAENPVAFVQQALAAFANGAEQHDDITMLALTAKTTTELSLAADVREFANIKAEILKAPLPRQKQLALCLAAEECFVNICSYAFGDHPPQEERITCTLTVSDRLTLRLVDGGIPFNPLENIEVPEDYDIDECLGGLGRLIATHSVDGMEYVYQDGKNTLTLVEYLEEEDK